MNIVIFGAGAIGSLFGALLAKKNSVVLVGRRAHITQIQESGLIIKGKTRLCEHVPAVEKMEDIPVSPDIILLTVKSYDTEIACKQILPYIQNLTAVVSLQNGLDNVQKIEQYIERIHILAGVTMHGAIFSKPGEIIHSGEGKTLLGELSGSHSGRLKNLIRTFNEAGILTQMSSDIKKDIWGKTIINSSINPVTAFLDCRNGYLLENPLLERTCELICKESTSIAHAEGLELSPSDMIQRTKKVLRDTKTNYSSMLQSRVQGKRTEIDSINGQLIALGKKHKINTQLNEILYTLVTSLP